MRAAEDPLAVWEYFLRAAMDAEGFDSPEKAVAYAIEEFAVRHGDLC